MLIKANYYSLSPRRFIAGTKNSYGVETLGFEFGPEWDGLSKTVTFYPAKGKPVAVIYGTGPIKIPAEVMKYPGLAQFTLSGQRNEQSLISVTGYMDILDANDPGGDLPVTPTPSEMDQVLTLMNKAVETAESVRRDADNGLFNGEKGDTGNVNITNIDEVAAVVGAQIHKTTEAVAVERSSFFHLARVAGDVYIESDTVNKKFFVKFDLFCVRGSVAQTIGSDKTINEIASACGLSLVTSTKGVSGCLCIPDEYVLSYCTEDNTFKYAHRGDSILKGVSNIVIIAQNGGRFVDGLPFIQHMMIEALEDKVGEGGTSEGNDTHDPIPSYWENSISVATKAIQSYQNAGGIDTFTFGFITDTHIDVMTKQTFTKLMEKVLNDCDIPVFLHGGDIVSGSGIVSKSEHIAEILRHKEIFKGIEDKCLLALGNHDPAFGVSSYYDSNLTDAEIYNYIFRRNQCKDSIVSGNTGRYYYKDIASQKVRYIILDCFGFKTATNGNGLVISNNKMERSQFGAAQLSWLANVALNVPENYSVVICSHIPPYRESDKNAIGWTGEGIVADCHIALGIVNAYRKKKAYNYSGSVDGETYSISADYSNADGEMVCWAAGHTHKDYIFDLDGLKVVCTLNNSKHQSLNPEGFAPLKEIGTATEFAMDFFCVNKATKYCYVVRLGACLDGFNIRSFKYGESEVPVKKSFTLDSFHQSEQRAFDFEEGMTWGEWKASYYNAFTDQGGNTQIFKAMDNVMSVTIDIAVCIDTPIEGITYENGTPVKDNEVIEATTYYFKDLDNYFPSGDGTVTVADSCPTDPETYTFTFKRGMTWGEFIASDYNRSRNNACFTNGMESDFGIHEVEFYCGITTHTTPYYTNELMYEDIELDF